MAKSKDSILHTGALVFLVVILHNCLGYVFGYLLAKAFGMSLPKRKTLAIEIGMQNSGLGVALAMKFFDPASAVPSAISLTKSYLYIANSLVFLRSHFLVPVLNLFNHFSQNK